MYQTNVNDQTYWLLLCESNDANNVINKIPVQDYKKAQTTDASIFVLN